MWTWIKGIIASAFFKRVATTTIGVIADRIADDAMVVVRDVEVKNPNLTGVEKFNVAYKLVRQIYPDRNSVKQAAINLAVESAHAILMDSR